MPKIQQAFLPGRAISEANVAVQEAYYRAAERGILKFWLLLDCSKGYKNMSWEWIEKVLQAANLPEGLVRAALRLVRESSEVVFVFERLVCSTVALGKGLAQGCPLSCVLYILAVDGMLEHVSKFAGVDLLVSFCDDWTIACSEIGVINRIQTMLARFEAASGQRMNKRKTKILTTITVASERWEQIRGQWHEYLVVAEAEVLGLLLGYSLSAGDYFRKIQTQYYARMSVSASYR